MQQDHEDVEVAMRVRRFALAAVAGGAGVVAALAGGVPAQAASSARFALPLSVEGNRVVDANHSTVVLNGLHREGSELAPSATALPSFPSADEVSWMGKGHAGSWNANIVRVPLGSAQWTGACTSLYTASAAYKAAVDTEVQQITGQGMLALLDLHTSTAGCTSIDRHAMPDAPVTQQFWSDVAAHFAGNPLVAFELYNEPRFVTDAVWRNGTSGATFQDCDTTAAPEPLGPKRVTQLALLAACQATKPKYQAVGMQELYNLVTTAAPGHLVVVDGLGWATTPPTTLLSTDGKSLLYAVHPYTCSDPANNACATPQNATVNRACLDKWLTLGAQAPVLVSEVGWPTYPGGAGTAYVDGAGFYTDTIAYLRQQGWGIVGFAFDGNNNGMFDLVNDTTAYTPNSTGQPLYDLLRSQP